MKYTYISRIKNSLATAFLAFVAVLAFSSITNNQIAFAGSSYDYDGWGSWDSYDYSDYSSPSYDYSGWGSWDSYDYSYPSYSDYSYTPSYDYSSPSYGSGYTYTPQPSYSYIPYTTGSSGSGGGTQYVYSSNTNNNANANTNTISNTFNPTNNNDAKINLIVYGGGGSTNTNTDQALNGSCVINPTIGYINQDVTFTASATGGNGSYSYSWTGDNGMYSNAQNFTGRYSYSGYKTATVTITSGGQSITRTCGVNIQDNNINNNSAYCVANPTNAGINQNVTWTVYPSNNGSYNNYSYSWTGTDNLFGSGQTITRSYNTPGYKTATVTMYGNGQTITTTCNTNINGILGGQSNVTVIRDQNLGTPVSGIFLSQVPETGISFGFKMTLFSIGLILWSIFAAYMIARRKGSKATFVEFTESSFGTISDKVTAFKRANMQKKRIQG